MQHGSRQAEVARVAAGGDHEPYVLSWRGFDNPVYYMVDTDQYVQMLNYSGCGNTISGNHPVTKQMIIDSCRRCAIVCTCQLP